MRRLSIAGVIPLIAFIGTLVFSNMRNTATEISAGTILSLFLLLSCLFDTNILTQMQTVSKAQIRLTTDHDSGPPVLGGLGDGSSVGVG